MIAILDNLRSIYNCASIFRTADGAGIEEIFLCGTTPAPIDKWGRGVAGFSKVSLGAEKNINWQAFRTTQEGIEEAKSIGYNIVAIEQSHQSVSVYDYSPDKKIALVVGPEVTGMDQSVLGLCDTIVEIPMLGQKESLNVGVAFGIAAYILKQKNVN